VPPASAGVRSSPGAPSQCSPAFSKPPNSRAKTNLMWW
jgi:hypothetical protein